YVATSRQLRGLTAYAICGLVLGLRHVRAERAGRNFLEVVFLLQIGVVAPGRVLRDEDAEVRLSRQIARTAVAPADLVLLLRDRPAGGVLRCEARLVDLRAVLAGVLRPAVDRKSTRLNSS